MKKNRAFLFPIVIFVIVLFGIVYIAFFQSKAIGAGKNIVIKITGDSLISEKDYLSFAHLNKTTNLPVEFVKTRLSKHPYVKEIDAELKDSVLVVKIIEKKFEATLLGGKEPYLITEDKQIVPVLNNVQNLNLPVINNVIDYKEIVPLNYINDDYLISSLKMIEAMKLINFNLYKSISEISIDDGRVEINFSGINTPFYMGKGDEIRKVMFLDVLLCGIKDGQNIIDESEYVDLRYKDKIFTCNIANTGTIE